MCLTGGTIGKIIKVGKVDEPLLQNYRVGHFSPLDSEIMGNDYMFYLMSSEVIVGQIFFDVRETGQPNIGMEDMNRMRICIPPIEEQTQIVEYLDEQTQKIDSTIEKETNRIELLQEYRQSLISEVVTGKVDVRDWKN
jgi:type I restriction enzyme S subunit